MTLQDDGEGRGTVGERNSVIPSDLEKVGQLLGALAEPFAERSHVLARFGLQEADVEPLLARVRAQIHAEPACAALLSRGFVAERGRDSERLPTASLGVAASVAPRLVEVPDVGRNLMHEDGLDATAPPVPGGLRVVLPFQARPFVPAKTMTAREMLTTGTEEIDPAAVRRAIGKHGPTPFATPPRDKDDEESR